MDDEQLEKLATKWANNYANYVELKDYLVEFGQEVLQKAKSCNHELHQKR